MWITFACLSAVFAALTAILAKCGVKKTDSDLATAVRTTVVLVLAWIVVFITGEYNQISAISPKSLIFLLASGVATGASWLCYFKALSLGEVSKVAAVDKSSAVLSVLFAIVLFSEERDLWYIKLACLAAIALGTYLMTDIKKGDGKTKAAWLVFAILSAVFAAATSVLAKIGITGVPSNLATAIRTCVVLVMAWLIVICRKKIKLVKEINFKEFSFLFLSGVATALSWLCYYYALANGKVSVVVPVDKMSVLLTVLFSLIVFKEKLSFKALLGLFFLTAGTVCMAIFT